MVAFNAALHILRCSAFLIKNNLRQGRRPLCSALTNWDRLFRAGNVSGVQARFFYSLPGSGRFCCGAGRRADSEWQRHHRAFDRDQPAAERRSERGFTYYLIYTNDVLSNLSGGTRRGTIDQGKLEAQFTLDLEKFAGWKDLTLYANLFQTHNTGRMRRDYIGGMNTIAAIEANPSIRLSELWFERKFWDGAASFRIGQLVADNEFFFSDLSNMFLQTDWPTITAVNLPGGAPAYPLSTPGARVKFDVTPNVSLLAAVFNGDPAGPCAGDPDTCNRYGLNFRLRDPALGVAEAQFRSNQGKDDTGLAQTI